MSKSIGNTILPQDVIKESGADIIRLWVAMSDYREEIRLGKEILARVAEAYRKIRNTLRYLLGESVRFRSGQGSGAAGAARRSGSLHPRALRGGGGATSCATTRNTNTAPIFQALNAVRHGRPERVLQRHLEGPALHVRAALARAPLGADGDVSDGRRADAPAGADPVVHGGRALAAHPGRTGGISAHRGVPGAAGARCVRRPGAGRALEHAGRTPRAGRRADRAAAQEQADRQLAAGQGHRVGDRQTSCRCWSSTRSSCRCCSSCPRSRCGRRRPTSRRPARPCRASRSSAPPASNASAAGAYVPEVSSDPASAGLCDRCQDALAETRSWITRSRRSPGASRRRRRRRRGCSSSWLPMVVVAIDQATKAMVRASVPLHDTVTVIPGFFNITHVLNSGAAFGILERRRLPVQDRDHRGDRHRRADRRRHVRGQLAHHQLRRPHRAGAASSAAPRAT